MILYKDLILFASCVHFGFVEVPFLATFSSLCSALFCIFESFACKPCSRVLPALWKEGEESPTSIVLMSKLEWRRFETLLVFSLKIKIVWKLYIQIIAEIRPGKRFFVESLKRFSCKDLIIASREVNYLEYVF